ncbi:T9SS type A sorting domain-containing protein [Candidatus Fermentibacterales bacterium]|nr:T9SS type A sorting domain-containing protein [Candidatus Fermentibacterales bacterium]
MRYLLVLAAYAGLCAGSVLEVPGEYATIQSAIFAAVGGDTVLVAPGIYVENIYYLGKAITITSVGGPAVTLIDGSEPVNPDFASVVRFLLGEGPDSVLDGFTLTGGTGTRKPSPSGPGQLCGGAAYCWYASPTVTNCVMTENSADWGGAIYCQCSSAAIANCRIEDNQGSSSGGGVYFGYSSCAISNSIIARNSSVSGGGLFESYSSDTTFVTNCVLAGNSVSSSGGGFYLTAALTGFRNTILWDNSAPTGPSGFILFSTTSAFLDYCDVEDGPSSIVGDGVVWGEGNLEMDPLFFPGPLSDYHLSPLSPCVDAGDPDPEYSDPEDPEDPGHALWPSLGGLRNDMGAYGGGGSGGFTAVESSHASVSSGPSLGLVRPNPSSGQAVVEISLPESAEVALSLFSLDGRVVHSARDGWTPAGTHTFSLGTGAKLRPGVYLVVVEASGCRVSRRFVVL